MGLIDRFTRDAASKYVWAVLALVAAGGLVFAITNGARALDDERANAQARAVLYVEEALGSPDRGRGPRSRRSRDQQAASLDAAVQRTILADDRLSRVRIWSADGRLLFSTDGADTLGSNAGLNDELLQRGVARRCAHPLERLGHRRRERPGAQPPADVRADRGIGGRRDRPDRRGHPGGGADRVAVLPAPRRRDAAPVPRHDRTVAPRPDRADQRRRSLRRLVDPRGLLSDRQRSAPRGPRGLSARVGARRADAEKLEESEEARRRLEGDIQRVLSKAATAPRSDTTPPIPPPAPAPEPPVVRVPESDVVAKPLGDAWTASPAGPLARASRDQKPPPATARMAKPAAEKPKRASKRPRVEEERTSRSSSRRRPRRGRRPCPNPRLRLRRRRSRRPSLAWPRWRRHRRPRPSGRSPRIRRSRREGARGRPRDVHPPHRERPAAARHELRRPGSGPGSAGADGRPEEAGRRAAPAARGPARGIARRPTPRPTLS